MCGILAVVDFKDRTPGSDALVALRDTMSHRGPDDCGLFRDRGIALGHRRLSIIDLSAAGHQPMTNEDGSLLVVFNGEIYNYLELRRDLLDRGHRFTSATDTEVILHQYEEDGERCVEKFRGMFAFAIWDSRAQKLFAARDRFGIKPLYYWRNASRVLLASEIKAIIQDDDVPRRPDLEALADYFYTGRPLGSKTLLRDIFELEPGCHLTVDRAAGSIAVKRYWELRYDYNFSRTHADTVDELASIIDQSVAVHCRSDAPLGCHLSGGLDSGSVAALAARHRGRLKTFSIKFSDDEHVDETRYARLIARHIGGHYLEHSPSPADMVEHLPRLIWHMDMPMVSEGAFGYFAVSEFARNHVKVALTGHGGDEIFAGYPAQFQATFNDLGMFRLYPDPDRESGRPGLIRRGLRKGPRRLLRAILARATRRSIPFDELWAALHCAYEPADHPHLHPAFVRRVNGYSPREAYVAPFARAGTDQTLDKCLFHDLTVYLPSLLHLEDRVSMAVSLESRVPLLDHPIVEFLATVPPHLKVNGREPKHLLRRVSAAVLPEAIWQNRDKRGFPVPGSFWNTAQLRTFIRTILLSKECVGREIFSPKALRAVCDGNDVTAFWPLVNVELWFRLFIDQDTAWLDRARDRTAALSAS
ncbi:MAG TPA: asparagine synthase (glutamine-hydrolyzing) [Vicinamibacterales bacterium]|nr:asparagine synthase (glutamine-hydrolyzing) [Vicinamibacterales bacterium]